MRILADENIYRGIVEWLCSIGNDVEWIAEIAPSVDDESILERANREGRVIITADLDFGELIIRRQTKAPGLLILRTEALPGLDIEILLRQHWAELEPDLPGNLVILTPRHLRKRPIVY